MSVWDSLYGSRSSLARQVSGTETAHAWLLLGPSGSGKRSAAKAMAAALNCEEEPGSGCGRCHTCARIGRGRHPDVHHIVPEGPIIPVDVVREVVIPEAARSPFEGRRKVFVIEEAERMHPYAQNALLKTLEEPQEDTVFILISDREEELLDTIRSRCRIVRLEPVEESQIVELLRGEGASEETARLASRLADGDVELARSLALDEAAIARRWLWRGIPGRLHSARDAFDAAAEILAEARDAVKAREQTQKDEITELADAMGEGRGSAAARNALAKRHKRELRRLEEEVLGEALRSLASFYRDVLAARSGASEAIANIDMAEDIKSWAAADLPSAALVTAIERCIQARAHLLLNANPALTIEAVLVELASIVGPPALTTAAW